jgi:pimeloyl-ACP methyl ester carboxylesterase
MQYAHVGAVRLACDLHPAATASADAPARLPVLLIMGFMMPGRAWRLVLPQLTAEHTVCTFDNRGAGDSDAPPGPYAMADLAGDAVGLLDHLGWPRAHVVGISMGGMIAQHVALTAPARVASLTLIATHAGGGVRTLVPPASGLGPFVAANALAAASRALKDRAPARISGPLRRGRYAALSQLLFSDAHLRAHDLDARIDLLARDFEPPAPEAGRKGQLAAVFAHDTRARLAELGAIPTLVVKAPDDRLIDPRHSDALAAAIPNARLMSLDGAGHGLVREMPERLGGLIANHLAVAERGVARGA